MSEQTIGKVIASEIVLIIRELNRMEENLKRMGIPRAALSPIRRELARRMEELPINWEGMREKGVLFFVLTDGEWWPAHGGYEVNGPGSGKEGEGPNNGLLNYRIEWTDGSVESGTAREYRWAHCTADNLPYYHWFEEEGD